MKKYTILAILILAFSILSASQYLGIVKIADIDDEAQFEKLKLPYYHHFGDALLVGLDDDSVEQLRDTRFQIIDDNAWEKQYYLLTSYKPQPTAIPSNWGDILYQDDHVILVATDRSLDSELSFSEYSFTRLYPIPKYFDATRHIGRSVHTHRTQVQDMVDSVNADTLASYIQSLQDFETRYWNAPNRDEVANWIKGEFERFGYTDVVLDSFYYNNTWQKNVVATIEGNVDPDVVIILGAHHDSIIFNQYGNPMITAPGADDNGSGTAAVLEIARIFKEHDYQPPVTYRFATFAAEEAGLHGSHHYAEQALQNDMNILAMINQDMISYTTGTPSSWTMKIHPYTGSETLTQTVEEMTPLYTDLNLSYGSYNTPGSDSYAFWVRGFQSIFLFEHHFNPYYHSPQDLIIHTTPEYCAEIVKVSLASSIAIIDYPLPPSNLHLADPGSGDALVASWSPPVTSNYDGFNVFVGTQSGQYSDDFTTQDTTFTIEGLQEGTLYYVGVSSYSDEGFESPIVERSHTPLSVPRIPENVRDFPSETSVVLSWDENTELDFAGYNVYRSEIEGEIGEIFNNELLTEPTFEDTDMEAGNYYYYTITAQDLDGNESEGSEQIRSRLITLDQGILIVNSSPDGTGSIGSPTHEDLENFYSYLLDGYQSEVYGLDEMGDIKLADLGAYSSIVWQADSRLINPFASQVVTDLTQYLEHGGNLLVSSFFPTKLFAGTGGYPSSFEPGQLIYDYLKIESTDYSQAAYFNEAISAGEYSSLEIDPEKALPTANHHIPFISVISPTPDASAIFLYGSEFDPSSPQGSLFGLPVGIEYLGDDYNLVMLSFPLYYTVSTQAKSFVDYVLTEKFAEEVSADPQDLVHKPNTRLHPNYPNPFNPETTISFHIASEGNVKLDIYNVKGQLVTTLIDKNMSAGTHQIVWDGKDGNGSHASSGVYLYRLKTADHQSSRKMILLK
jgi:hypothetical protein